MVPLVSRRPSLAPSPGAVEFRDWYDAHLDYVWRSLRRLGVPPADVADICHDVFVAAWRQRAELDPARPIKPWLFGVAFRLAANHRRRSWFRRRSDAQLESVLAHGLDPEQRVLLIAELERLDAALGQVPLKLRGVLLLHDFDEVPPKEIAQALGIPLKTIYSRLAAARKRFRQAFRQSELHDLGSSGHQVVLGGPQ